MRNHSGSFTPLLTTKATFCHFRCETSTLLLAEHISTSFKHILLPPPMSWRGVHTFAIHDNMTLVDVNNTRTHHRLMDRERLGCFALSPPLMYCVRHLFFGGYFYLEHRPTHSQGLPANWTGDRAFWRQTICYMFCSAHQIGLLKDWTTAACLSYLPLGDKTSSTEPWSISHDHIGEINETPTTT